MEDFNSSDVCSSDHEIMQAVRTGRAKASIIAKAREDRTASKKIVKHLKDTRGAPGMAKARQYVFDLFKTFQEHTLQKEPGSEPTGYDIERFMYCLPNHLDGTCSDDGKTVSWDTVQNLLDRLLDSFRFHFEDFKLSQKTKLRIDTILDEHLRNNILTKNPIRQRLWITVQIVRRMVNALLKDALSNGTRSWDVVIMRVLSVVLQAAMCCRSGDFLVSDNWVQIGGKHLIWKHIEVKVTGPDEQDPRLAMLITLYYCKGRKGDPESALQIELGQLPDIHNVVDPTKLLLVHALRIGAVAETSWQSLVRNALARPSRRVLWSKPEWPVVSALNLKASRLDVTKPGHVKIQQATIKIASDLIGLLQQPRTHDIRRGAASDLAAIGMEAFQGATIAENARLALSHTRGAFQNGETDKYIGRVKTDTWRARLLHNDAAKGAAPLEDPFGVQFAVNPPPKEIRLSAVEISDKCEVLGLDATNSNHRGKAGRILRKERRKTWQESEKALVNTPVVTGDDGQLPHTNGSAVIRSGTRSKPSRKRSFQTYQEVDDDIAAPRARPVSWTLPNYENPPCGLEIEEDSQEWTLPSYENPPCGLEIEEDSEDSDHTDRASVLDEDSQDSDYTDHPSVLDEDSDNEPESTSLPTLTNPDAQIQSTRYDLSLGRRLTSDDAAQGETPSANVPEHTVEALAAVQDPGRSEAFKAPAWMSGSIADFINELSRINLVAYDAAFANNALPKAVEVSVGGSRTEPTRFLYKCKKCPRAFQTKRLCLSHEALCRAVQGSASPEDDEASTTTEGRPSPSVPSLAQPSLAAPGNKTPRPAYPYKPKVCPQMDECGETKILETRYAWNAHRAAAHGAWEPSTCKVGGCVSKTIFQHSKSYYQHLTSVHHLSFQAVQDELQKVNPSRKTRVDATLPNRFVQSLCLYPGCKQATREWETYAAWTDHARRQHDLETEDIGLYMPTAETAKHYHVDVDLSGRQKKKFPSGGQLCTFPNCDSDKTFLDRGKYTTHLKNEHSLTPIYYAYFMDGDE